jgi:CheY-specific phosphatase CheX
MLQKKVDTILKIQKRINKYFGQLAVQMGFLTKDQVSYLLQQQQEHYIEIEEIIRREKIVPDDVIQKELETFQMLDEDDQGVFNMRWVSRFIENGYIFETFIEQTLKLVMRLAGIFVMEGECSFEKKEFAGHGVVVKISITGDQHWNYILNLSEDLALMIAEAMLESEEEDYHDNIGVEAASEFANIACGNAIGKLDTKGIKLEILPPHIEKTKDAISFKQKEQVLSVPILVPDGEMDLIISGVGIFKSIEDENNNQTLPLKE